MNTTASRPALAARAYLACQLVGWSAYALLGLLITRVLSGLTPALALTTSFGCALALLGTHLLRRAARRGGWWDEPVSRSIPRLFAGALIVASGVELSVWGFGLFVTRVYALRSSTPAVMFLTTLNWTFITLLWTALYASVQFFRRYRLAEIRRLQLEVAAREAQLASLQAQIHPHFLFNALNSLRALITEDPPRARDLVTGLSELMRYALQAGRREGVPLAEELAIVEGYLRLEGARFEDRLRWSIDAPPALHQAVLPPMALQSLVENAVKHGIAQEPAGGDITVTVSADAGRLRLRVLSPGRIGGARVGGIGLANVEQRLRLSHGPTATVRLEQLAEHQVAAEISLPLIRLVGAA